MQILITGASGLIGRELAGVLAERGHGVFALMHRAQGLSRNDGRTLPTTAWAGTPPEPGGIVAVQGDVCSGHFGLAPDACARLADSLDLIVHCAALTGFALPPARYAQVNIGGTANVLEVAAGGAVPVLLVSTAYVCGERSGPIEERPTAADVRFANGYESSKAAAEHLALAAAARGLPVAIARPSIVMGSTTDGAIGAFGGIYQLLRLLSDGRITALPADPAASLDLVPIDHVVDGLVDLAERIDDAAGGIFHLVSSAPMTLRALHRAAGGFPHLRRPCLIAPEQFDPDRLSGRERLLHEQVTAPYANYLQRDPRFCDRRFEALTGRRCPDTGDGFLRRIVEYCMTAGFLRSAVQRTSG
ncbi:SDR family oxidoreductase [Lichenicoccus sp.]|uniref:SDR family oxidoreductase n=1 Tax=Lichenicoccus sp. TaxID=2781899 RepID=UPI003D13B217